MRDQAVILVVCLLLVGALAACAGSPSRDGPRGRGPGGGPERNGVSRSLKTSAGTLFASSDSNQDIQISRAELKAGIDRAFARADLNHDQDIAPLEFESFAKGSLDCVKSPPFRLDFDRDVDGLIALKEFQTELTAIADSLDADKDAALSHAELLKASETQGNARARGEGRGAGGPRRQSRRPSRRWAPPALRAY